MAEIFVRRAKRKEGMDCNSAMQPFRKSQGTGRPEKWDCSRIFGTSLAYVGCRVHQVSLRATFAKPNMELHIFGCGDSEGSTLLADEKPRSLASFRYLSIFAPACKQLLVGFPTFQQSH